VLDRTLTLPMRPLPGASGTQTTRSTRLEETAGGALFAPAQARAPHTPAISFVPPGDGTRDRYGLLWGDRSFWGRHSVGACGTIQNLDQPSVSLSSYRQSP